MTHKMGLRHFRCHPSIPHHLMRIKSVLWQTHGIHHPTGTIVTLPTVMRVCVREDNLGAAIRHTFTCTRTFLPVVEPSAHHLHSKLVVVLIVGRSVITPIQRAITMPMVGIGVIIPIATQRLISAILHGPHWLRGTLVDIEHLTSIFSSRVVIQHLTATNSTPTMRVELITNGLHLPHMRFANSLVTTLIKKNRRIVPVVYNSIPHQFHSLLPMAPCDILFCITCRHRLNQPHTVTRFHILLPRTDMHPTNKITARLHHQSIRIVAQPCRHTHAYSRPFVAGSLGISMHHDRTVVQNCQSMLKGCLTEPRCSRTFVSHFPLYQQTRLYTIQIPITP